MGEPDSLADNSSAGKQQTSLTLLQRLRAEQGDAWQTVMRLYGPLVSQWCVRGGVRGADIDDVSQEVFRVAASCLQDFRRDRPGDSFRGWLHGITHNMVLQHFRRDRRQPKAPGGTDALLRLQDVQDTPADSDTGQDTVDELDGLRRRALDLVRSEFEERTWQMFWLTAIDGRPPGDVAADMGVSAAAVRMAKSRILRRLKEEFGELIS